MSTQRKITVYSTKGKRKSVFESDATKWSELHSLLQDDGYDLSNLQATENVNKTTLKHQDAKLPEGDFTIFLRAEKTKSGAASKYDKMSFKELRAEMSEDDKTAISEKTGKNYTRCSTDELRSYLKSKGSASTTSNSNEAVAEEAPSNEDNISPLYKAKKVKSLLEEICEDTDNDDICERAQEMISEAEGLIADVEGFIPESDDESAKREELEKLDAEARDMEKGFM